MTTPIITDRDPGDEDPSRELCNAQTPLVGALRCSLKEGHIGMHSVTVERQTYQWENRKSKPRKP